MPDMESLPGQVDRGGEGQDAEVVLVVVLVVVRIVQDLGHGDAGVCRIVDPEAGVNICSRKNDCKIEK